MTKQVMDYLTEFFGGLATILMAVLPVTILWTVLTGTAMFGMDIVANLSGLVNAFGTGGFTGLVVLLIVVSFFVKK
jgi:hypothetical protein|tara:strand:- start:543 stop:770 length:228 start_codon:yes stop_codon:yes gene_type:complete